MEEAAHKSNNELAEDRTDLAVYRTSLAASRSLMAWVRTGLSMIGFGFTIYKFLQGVADQIEPNEARNVGLFLIAWGTLSILFGCVEYWQFAGELKRTFAADVRRFPLVMAEVVGFLGLALFSGIVARIF